MFSKFYIFELDAKKIISKFCNVHTILASRHKINYHQKTKKDILFKIYRCIYYTIKCI